jgi:hypothetical protein
MLTELKGKFGEKAKISSRFEVGNDENTVA